MYMNKLSGILKITFNFAGICAGFIALILFAYLWVIPHLIQSPKVISFVETKVHDICKVDLSIDKPILKTGLTPSITFTLVGLNLIKKHIRHSNLSNMLFDVCINYFLLGCKVEEVS